MTYANIIEELCRAENIRETWEFLFPASERKEAAKRIINFIEKEGSIVPSSLPGKSYFHFPSLMLRVKTPDLQRLFNFFFVPKKTIFIYEYD